MQAVVLGGASGAPDVYGDAAYGSGEFQDTLAGGIGVTKSPGRGTSRRLRQPADLV